MNKILTQADTDECKATELKIPTEVYSRISGYFRPVNQWNKGKREEYSDRKKAKVNEATLTWMKPPSITGQEG